MELYQNISDSAVDITFALDIGLPSTPGFIQIEDEVIAYQSADSRTLYGCSRGALNTTAAAHDKGTEATVFTPASGSPSVARLTNPTTIDWLYMEQYDVLIIENTSEVGITPDFANFSPPIAVTRSVLVFNHASSLGNVNLQSNATDSVILKPGEGKVFFLDSTGVYASY